MRYIFLTAFAVALSTALSAQSSGSFFSTFNAERGSVVAPARDGNLWLGGQKDERVLLAKLSPEGKVLDKHSVGFEGAGLDLEHLTDLFEESDGTLVGCGNFEGDNLRRGFVFRYNPATRQTLWAHIVRSGSINYLLGITQLGPGGDYVLYGNPHNSTGNDAELLQISQTSGQIVPGKAKRFGIGPADNIAQAVYHNGALYTCGRFTGTEPYPPARMRNALCKIDTATLEPIWTRLGPLPTSSSGQFHGRDLIIDNGAIVSTYSGDHVSPDLAKSEVYLQKNDLDGNILWARQYKLPAFAGEFAEEIINLPDGYLLYGHDILTDTSRLFLLKTDKEGNAITAVKIDFGLNDEFPEIPARSKILRLGDALFFTAVSQNNLGQTQGIFVKTNLNLTDSCDFIQKTPVTFSDWDSAISQPSEPSVTASTATLTTATFSQTTPSLTFEKKCGATGTCSDLPDIAFEIESVGCDSAAFVSYRLCNIGATPYSGPLEVGVYESNPLTGAAILLDQFTFQVNDLPSDSCQTGSLKNLIYWGNYSKVFTLAGIESGQITPVDPAGFPYNGIPECDYANNLDSLGLQYPPAPQKPDLGPDRILCAGDNLLLDAGAGFVSYHWSNSLTTRAIAINTTGVYILEATDACGRILSDTVAVTILPQPAPTTLTIPFYPGDTVFLAGTPYTQPDTVVQTLLTANGCDSVVTTILQLVITTVDLTCPANLTVPLPANQFSINLTYPLPAASTDCPDPDIAPTLLQGLPVGGAFPPGNTLVCYEAANQCGARDTCCFMIAIQPEVEETACDVKTPPGSCIKYELLGIRLDSLGRPRYRMRLTNTCASPLRFAYFQTPNGMKAPAPADGAIYTAPGGNTYLVRNPNATPYHSIRFKAVSGLLNNGKSDIFEYTLPRQAQPVFILVSAGLEDGSNSRAHINTFGCPVQPYEANQQEPTDEAQYRNKATTAAVIQVRPNPTTGLLLVETPAIPDESVLISVLNARGQMVMEKRYPAGNTPISLQLSEELADGLYYLRVHPAAGAPVTTRFVLARTTD